jgi:hypothetical protein
MSGIIEPYTEAKGNVRVYLWRKGGKKIRLHEPLGSPEFVATTKSSSPAAWRRPLPTRMARPR